MKFKTEWEICHKEDFFQYLNKKQVPKDPIKFHLKYIQDVFALGELKNYLDNQKRTKKSNPFQGSFPLVHKTTVLLTKVPKQHN